MRLFIIGFFLFINHACSADFEGTLKEYKVSPLYEQSYCYQSGNTITGFQFDRSQRIASLTKIFTTLYASETQNLHRTFKTTVTVDGKRLHISGSNDPYFEEDNMLLLMQALNEKGYKNFDSVTFDKSFWFYDLGLSTFLRITPAETRSRLAFFFNLRNQSFLQNLWSDVLTFAEEEGVVIRNLTPPRISAKKVSVVEKNPITGGVTFVHISKPLHSILKSMNVMSKNHVAQNVYLESEKKVSVKDFIAAQNLKQIDIRNGSGLPIEGGGSRFDNSASCRTVLKLLTLLEQSLKKHKLGLLDVMAINGGEDLGSFRNRFKKQPETHQAVMAKTGTIKNASSLAGFLSSDELHPFAILNHTSLVANAREFQDEFVARLFGDIGTPKPLVYTKLSTFPWDGEEFLKEE
jgi:D-alanyl-D-alanine carboxypeptidase/D-alanyl-D-alanine-endopeptidase (penicillin-binding protein 4)